MTDVAVKIRGVYKIFGPNPQSTIKLINNGTSKQELMDTHGHILGLENIDIDIDSKGIQVIMGLSGSGKSTLIRHINRLIDPTAGEITVAGRDVLTMNKTELRTFRRFNISMVFQRFSLFPHRTVSENIAYGMTIQKLDKSIVIENCQKWLDRVGLTGFDNYYPAQLSGGMQQRVGLARALATDADILLMDEPFSALDPLIRTDMQDILLSLQEELHKTIIFITHDLDEALRIGANIAILRDGVIVQKGTPQNIIINPADDYVSAFIKDINRGRVLHVSSIMSNHKLPDGINIEHNTSIEEALQTLNNRNIQNANVTKSNNVIGSISLPSLISALVRTETDRGTPI